MKNTITQFYGQVLLEPTGEFIAGTHATFHLKYIAGKYGMDDLGGLKILFRFACDQSPLQTTHPKELGYISAWASNGAGLELSYHAREGERPWYKVLRVRIVGKGLKEGDEINLILGDKSKGSPGMRLQTFCEPFFEFRTMVDAFSTNVFIPVPSPKISLISGPPYQWRAYLPTVIHEKEVFSLKFRAEDKWGNPTDKANLKIFFKSTHPIKGLPRSYHIKEGNFGHIIEGLQLGKDLPVFQSFEDQIIYIDLFDSNSNHLARTNPMVFITKNKEYFKHYWGDLHAQSEETIGTNSAEMFFKFARDHAFLDIIGHQGNDFQITKELWRELNELSNNYHEKNKFIPLFGYEYSANTSLGGDHNVYFLKPHQQIHRSSHALISDKDDLESDCLTASELFSTLLSEHPTGQKSMIVIPHVGGRYADITHHFERKIEPSIEIHSAWGTFEWLLHDAFDMGYRVGIVANSDDHKGRPGIGYPGASKFGTQGGLTCFLTSELTRESIFKALSLRKHYATTGERIFLDIRGTLNCPCRYHEQDPLAGLSDASEPKLVKEVMMGDIIEIPENKNITVNLSILIASATPIERIEIFNGKSLLKTIRPYLSASKTEEYLKINTDSTKTNSIFQVHDTDLPENFPRIRIQWQGAEFRARKRNCMWKGTIEFVGNEILSTHPFNFWNQDSPLQIVSKNKISWNTYTAGNIQGFYVDLFQPFKGKLLFTSNQIDFELPLQEISLNDTIFKIEGGIDKKVSLNRYPKINPHCNFKTKIDLPINPKINQDHRIFVKITLENGHQAWSSPIYFIKKS